MTKHEHARRARLADTLHRLGFESHEVDTLRRISNTLQRWHELECGIDGGCIERNESTGKPYWLTDSGRRWSVADRESGALRRLAAIIADHAQLTTYIQTDPRGAALYILRPGDIPAGYRADSCYTNGICVY